MGLLMSAATPHFVVLRHSVRFDEVPLPGYEWTDHATRPHDPPIVDYELPAAVVEQ